MVLVLQSNKSRSRPSLIDLSPLDSPHSSPMADSDDLDQLLDSALDDFTKLDLSSSRRLNGEREEKRSSEDSTSSSTTASTTSVQGLGQGMGLPDQRRGKEKKGKQRAGPLKGMSHASEALEKLTQETREAVMGLGAAAGMGGPGVPGEGDLETEKMVEDFVKQFEQLSGGGSQDMESIVETMMQQLLSKEILYEPMREIGERYPKWLEEHKEGLNSEDYERYSRQHELIVSLNEVYEYDPNNFPKIVELMQKMQECGQPPSDIVHELAPDLDLNNLGGQLSPEMFENASQCSVM